MKQNKIHVANISFGTNEEAVKTQVVSAAKSSISERSGRNIEKGKRQAPKKKARHWRTRKDPLADVLAGEK